MTGDDVRDRDSVRPVDLAASFDARLPAWVTPRNLFLGLLLISLIVDLVFGFVYKFRAAPAELEADELEYYNMAGSLLAGTFELTARRTLAFPLLIAGVRSFSASFVLLQVAVAAFYSFSAPLLSMVVRRVTGSIAAGALAGLVLAIWPPAVYYGVSLYSETMALPVFLLAMWALPAGARTGRPRGSRDWLWALASGLLLAAATQVRPMYLIMTPFLALIVLIEEGAFKRAVQRVALVALAFSAVTLPWAAHMTMRFHHPILITSNGGETLAGGLSPKLLEPWSQRRLLTGGRNVWVGPGKWLTLQTNGYLSPAELKLPYDQQDKLLKERTIAWVKANPGAAAHLEACKLLYMWGFYPLLRNGWAQLLLGSVPTIILLGFATFCLATMRTARTTLARFWVLPVFVSAVAAISWGSWRFRQPGDVGLIAFCVVCLLLRQAARRAAEGSIAPVS